MDQCTAAGAQYSSVPTSLDCTMLPYTGMSLMFPLVASLLCIFAGLMALYARKPGTDTND